MSALRWLVVGASGLVGGALVRELRAHGHEAVGAARTPRELATMALDLASPQDISRGLDEAKPDVVVVASAWPHVDGCEADPARSRRENVETVANLVRALGASATKVVFYSTDHVFDGSKDAPYVESDAVHPPSVYARDKRAVEELLTFRGRSLVLRTAWVFGPESRRKNFVYRVVDAAARGETLKLPRAQAGCPTDAAWLAEVTRRLVEDEVDGIVHATGGELFTKAGWAHAIAEALELGRLHTEEVEWAAAGQVAPRPVSVALRSARHAYAQGDVRARLRAMRAAILASAS